MKIDIEKLLKECKTCKGWIDLRGLVPGWGTPEVNLYLKSFKGRKIDTGKTVEVYRNLNGDISRRWSIRQGGLVRAHAEEVQLSQVRFKVSHRGWLRMKREGRRNVHAVAVGRLIENPMPFWAGDYRTVVRYDRDTGHFRDENDNRVERAYKAHFGNRLRVEGPDSTS